VLIAAMQMADTVATAAAVSYLAVVSYSPQPPALQSYSCTLNTAHTVQSGTLTDPAELIGRRDHLVVYHSGVPAAVHANSHQPHTVNCLIALYCLTMADFVEFKNEGG